MVAERLVSIDCCVCNGHGIINFQDAVSEERDRAGRIMVDVASRCGVTVGDLIGPSRGKRIAEARHESCYLMRIDNISYKNVGMYHGGRDHSTALSSVRVYCEKNGLPIPPRTNGG